MSIDLDQWATRIRAVADRQLRAALDKTLVEFALDAQGRARDNATRSPRRRTGSLVRSITGTTGSSGGKLWAALSAGGSTGGADLRYAAAQEYGATITPRKGRFLAVATDAAKTGAGVSRKGPRDYPDLRFVPTRGGAGGMLVRDAGRGKTARTEVMFWLVRQVKVPATHYAGRAFDAARADLPEAVHDAVTVALLKAGGLS